MCRVSLREAFVDLPGRHQRLCAVEVGAHGRDGGGGFGVGGYRQTAAQGVRVGAQLHRAEAGHEGHRVADDGLVGLFEHGDHLVERS